MWVADGRFIRNSFGKSFEFEFYVRGLLEKEDCVFVLVRKPTEVIMPENAFCVNNSGSLRWQIKPNAKIRPIPGNFYTGIEDHGIDERIFFFNALGFLMEVDVSTGEVVGIEETH
jgi:hypothetical protein